MNKAVNQRDTTYRAMSTLVYRYILIFIVERIHTVTSKCHMWISVEDVDVAL